MEAEPDPAPLLCWCCALWGLTAPVIEARQMLCAYCLNTTPAACAAQHKKHALAAAGTPEPAEPIALSDPS